MEPVEYVRALRARWWVVVATGLFALAAAWVTTPARPPAFQGVTSFTATHTLILDDPSPSETRTVDLARAALLARTGEVPRRVVDALGIDAEPAVVATRISVRQDSEVRTVAITVGGDDGPQTQLLADTVAAELVRYLDEREQARQQRELDIVKDRMDDLQRQSTELGAQIPGLPETRRPLVQAQFDALVRQFGLAFERFQQLAAEGPASVGLVTLEKATPIPIVSGGFRPPASKGGRIAIAVPLGLLLGAGVVLLAKRVDTRIATKDEAERAFGLPVVAEIPLLPRSRRGERCAAAALAPTALTAEAYRTLRTSIRLMPPHRLHPPGSETAVADAKPANGAGGAGSPGGDGRVVLVASAERRDGRTSVVASLAASFARTSKAVIVLDFDRLKPDAAAWLGASPVAEEGPAAFSGRFTPIGPAWALPTSVPGVRVMREWPGQGDTTEALEAGRVAVASARRLAEVVIMDTPPLLSVADAGELVASADTVVLVCRAGRTTAESAARASELLGRLGAAVLGVVLVGVPRSAKWRRRSRTDTARRGHLPPIQTPDAVPAAPQPEPPAELPAEPPADTRITPRGRSLLTRRARR